MRAASVLLAAVAADSSALRLSVNPITRVAKLLSDLGKKLEADAKEEKKLFNKFECWCTKVQKAKDESIEKAESRIEELTHLISDLDAGKIELTDERENLEKQVDKLKKEKKKMEKSRDRQIADYDTVKDETEKAIAALDEAITRIDSQTEEGSLAVIKWTIKKALPQDSSFISTEAHKYLAKLGAPDDVKNLNKDAKFQEDYSKKSGKIKQTLNAMKSKFGVYLSELEEKEATDLANYNELHTAKTAELDEAKTAMTNMEEENAARRKAKNEAEDEKTDLEDNNTADRDFKTETQTTCDDKKTEFETRETARNEEQEAIQEAISILRSDDARDTFKKSFNSQTAFVQLGQAKKSDNAAKEAAAQLRAVANGNSALRILAAKIETVRGTPTEFEAIFTSIDDLVKELKEDQDQDLADKTDCDSQRREGTITAKRHSKTIDKKNGEIEELKQQIVAHNDDIKALNTTIAELHDQLREAETNREVEHARYQADKLDDQTAKSLVHQAKGVLKTKYESMAALQKAREFTGLAQTGSKADPIAAGGEAPPPPPSTFSGTYEGAQGAAKGILAILATVEEDIQHDIDKADAEEDSALTAYNKFKDDTETSIEDKEDLIGEIEGTIADKEGEIGDLETDVSDENDSLNGTLTQLKTIEPGCDFIAVNYETRTTRRNDEIDGLAKAKAILQGAKFD